MTDLTDRMMPSVPRAACWLGLAGLLPFAAGALGYLVLGEDDLLRALMIGYGVAILSFMGGCRWGLAAAGLGHGPVFWPLALSVLPCLYGWLVALLPGAIPFFALAAGFAGLLAADLRLAAAGGAPAWWPALRWPLSLGAIASLCVAGIA